MFGVLQIKHNPTGVLVVLNVGPYLHGKRGGRRREAERRERGREGERGQRGRGVGVGGRDRGSERMVGRFVAV